MHHDSKTVASNYKAIVEEWLYVAAKSGLFGTIYVDIDRLMSHNDCFGHVIGDQTITRISDCLESLLPNNDHQFMRVGGDEFIVVVRGDSVASIFDLAEQLRKSVERMGIPFISPEYRRTYPFESEQSIVTVSLGVLVLSCIDRKGALVVGNWVLDCARNSVNFAKLAGRNKVARIDLR